MWSVNSGVCGRVINNVRLCDLCSRHLVHNNGTSKALSITELFKLILFLTIKKVVTQHEVKVDFYTIQHLS